MSFRSGQSIWPQLAKEKSGAGISLQWQVRQMMVSAILEARIPRNHAVPSCRELARMLGIGRNTVVLAYQQLVDDGFLVSRERSGYFVNNEILADGVPQREKRAVPSGLDWDSRLAFRPSTQRNISKPRDWQQYRYPFIYGQFDPSLFPTADWRECCLQALHVSEIRAWASDGVDQDDPILVEQIQSRLLPRRGIWASPDQILTTIGAQQALYLIASLLVRRESIVGVENPGYPDARNIFLAMTSQVKGLPVDEGGLVISDSLNECDYVCVTPSHQSPTTATMPLARRHELLDRAHKSDFVLIEDDYESQIDYVAAPSPSLKSLDRNDRVIYVGSLSKTLAPGVRFGYMVGPAELIREARALRRLMVRHPASNNQRAIALFLMQGHHDSLIRRLGHAYRDRWEVMREALNRHLPDASFIPTSGGTSYWIKGPDTLNVRALLARLKEQGILLEPGDVHFMSTEPPANYFRLGFSSIPIDRIEPGIQQLAKLIR
jgi:GntR family transcriptional regulator/MocR family aminotransferase